ncbi:MAG: DUF1684 domain-containing protein [Lysobacteraceae bacterium]|nr:MAG: DUF1684 domain-containing protein [Xanthomonadaceae bacterium]
MKPLGLALACGLALAACVRGPVGPTPEPATQPSPEAVAYARAQYLWRAKRIIDLNRPDGWTSLIGLHWLDPGAHRVGSDADNGIRLVMGPEHLGVFTVRGKQASFAPDTAVSIDGAPQRGATALRVDSDAAGPSRIAFDEGKGLATVIERGGRLALRVKHADAESRLKFAGLEYWLGGLDWQVAARFVPHAAGKTLPIANIIGTTDDIPNPGAVEFQRGGKAYRLEALDQGEGTLFLVFADRTSGHGSYGAGRFLDAPMPDAQGRLVLDFNQSYNPPCAFTPFATCPLPPPENRLDLAVEAGEKAYAKPLH